MIRCEARGARGPVARIWTFDAALVRPKDRRELLEFPHFNAIHPARCRCSCALRADDRSRRLCEPRNDHRQSSGTIARCVHVGAYAGRSLHVS
jgi:hypothetical protein